IAAAPDQEQVVGLQIAMDDPLGVARRQPRAALPEDVARLVELEWSRREARGQALALEQLHHDVDDEAAASLLDSPEVDDVDDVLVADVVGRLGLVEEARGQHLVADQLLEQHLDGDALADERMLAEVDGAHATLADLGFDLVVADARADQGLAP